MRSRFLSSPSLLLFATLSLALLPVASPAAESVWVTTGVTGRLIHTPDAEGDRVLDFSAAGYRGRGVEAIPDSVPVAVTVSPVPGDDTSIIQAAINAVGALPIGPDGYRGAVLLNAGEYDIGGQLEIRDSGVVLRGVGRGENDTVLRGRSSGPEGTNQRPLIRVYGSGGLSNNGSRRNLIDKVVPAGATSFRVDVPGTFAPGDTVRVIRATDDPWVSDIGMDTIPPRSDGGTVNQWTSTTINQRFDRVVTRVEGDRVFVDAPLPHSIDQKYGGGTIQKYTWGGAIENIGIESLRGVSDFDNDTDEDHAWEFISIGVGHTSSRAQNVWVRDIHGKHFGDSLVVANPGSKWVTVADAIHEEPKSVVTGGRRYTYDLSGELGLVTNATADSGRHDFVNNSTAPKGPNVFHNSTATNALSDTGPHQRYATGTLFDNVTIQGDGINARNRGNFGSGHGWSGANMVVWNATADSYIVQNPPGAQNWLVGSTGTIVDDTRFGQQEQGYTDSHGTAVTTGGVTSLYEAQMNDARSITSFEWAGGVEIWTDDLGWRQAVAPGEYAVSRRDYLVGDIDGYTADGGGSVDDAFIDPAWAADITSGSGLPLTGFDDKSGNKNVAFTIQHQLDVGERVIHGSLALALLESGGLPGNDFVRLFDDAAENRRTFVELGWDTQIGPTDTFVGVLDLGQSLDHLQSGSVNVHLNDDTALDWAIYDITVATPTGGSENADVALLNGGEAIVVSDVGSVRSLAVGGATSGSLAIGPVGAVTVADDYTQAANGRLSLSVGPGSNEGVDVLGDASLAGELALLVEAGFSVSLGDSFTLLSVDGETTGEFDTVAHSGPIGGLSWRIEETAAGVVATVVLAGDYNGDGVVDAADYTVWRDAEGGTGLQVADGDGDGVVTAGDLSLWAANFGADATAFSAAVPEPTAATLVLGALALGINRRIRRRFGR